MLAHRQLMKTNPSIELRDNLDQFLQSSVSDATFRPSAIVR
jgi:hypothetical protein